MHEKLFLCYFVGHVRPHFDSRSKVFELDPCGGFGKVCLVYNDLKAGEEKIELPYYLDLILCFVF